jgi:hypothetical protein
MLLNPLLFLHLILVPKLILAARSEPASQTVAAAPQRAAFANLMKA